MAENGREPVERTLAIEPDPSRWMDAIHAAGPGRERVLGRTVAAWRALTRSELGLPEGGPLVMTGHQPLFWHPGILAKFIATDAFAQRHGFATAQVVPDQDTGAFGRLDVPVRRPDGALGVRRATILPLDAQRPVGLQPATEPVAAERLDDAALAAVAEGVVAVRGAVARHAAAPDAGRQLTAALSDLAAPWARPMLVVTARDLMRTAFARAILTRMVESPGACAAAYNAAARQVPSAGVEPLLVRDDWVELPLWRLRDGKRLRAYDADVERWLEDDAAPALLPRALLLTALLRMVVCDLFVHGTGGAAYDAVTERWLERWLGARPAHAVAVTATLHLPLGADGDDDAGLAARLQDRRRLWHDPDGDAERPSVVKRAMLARIEAASYQSGARREAFFAMHRALVERRRARADDIADVDRALATARRRAADARIARRRDWSFAIYPRSAVQELTDSIRDAMQRVGASTP
jgi:hypothetical protein